MRCPDAFESSILPWILINHIFSEVFELFLRPVTLNMMIFVLFHTQTLAYTVRKYNVMFMFA